MDIVAADVGICATWFQECTMQYALCSMHYALCPMQYALCSMHYALCPMHYALLEGGLKDVLLKGDAVKRLSCIAVSLGLGALHC